MNVDQILAIAVKSIKSAMPEALYKGSLVKQTRAFNSSNSTTSVIDTVLTDVEIIFDGFTSEELVSSSVKNTDVKLHIIANNVSNIDFYDIIRANGFDYRIGKKLDIVVGSKTALFTIVASL